jgi:hypothetical protein
MTRRRRLRRRLLWAGVFFGLVLVYAVASTMRACLWGRDVVVAATKRRRSDTRLRQVGAREGGTMYGRFSLAALVAVTAMALAAPTAWADPWAADRYAQGQEAEPTAALSARGPVGDDHFRDPPDAAPVAAPTSRTETSWPQLGLGVGLVVVLALGALVTARQTRIRTLPR